MRVWASLFAAFLLPASLAGTPQRIPQAAPYPAPVLQELKALAETCGDGRKPVVPNSAVEKVDINNDGRPDYLIFSAGYPCSLGVSLMAPTAAAGVPTILYLGQAGGTVAKVWEADTWGYDAAPTGKGKSYTFQMSGLACGDRRGANVSVANRLSCTLQLRPDAAGIWALRPLVRGQPVPVTAATGGTEGIAKPGASAVPPADKAAIEQFVRATYAKFDSSRPAALGAPKLDRTIYTDDLISLVDRRVAETPKGDVPDGLDANWLCGCQDFDRIAVRSISLEAISPTMVAATVAIDNAGPRTIELVLRKAPAGWRVADVRDGTQWMRVALGGKALLADRPAAAAAPHLDTASLQATILCTAPAGAAFLQREPAARLTFQGGGALDIRSFGDVKLPNGWSLIGAALDPVTLTPGYTISAYVRAPATELEALAQNSPELPRQRNGTLKWKSSAQSLWQIEVPRFMGVALDTPYRELWNQRVTAPGRQIIRMTLFGNGISRIDCWHPPH
jgi:hypothetical protein